MNTSMTRYELPARGISLLGYVVRRMHKTTHLQPVASLVAAGRTAEALAQCALYAAAASASYGPAYYQPSFNARGETVRETDPHTGAEVWARLETTSPHYLIVSEARLPDGLVFSAREEIMGTTIGLGALGMPAPSRFEMRAGDYQAQATGVVTAELKLDFFRGTQVRAHGQLSLRDNCGNTGKVSLARDSRLSIEIAPAVGAAIKKVERLADWRPATEPLAAVAWA